MATRSIFGMKEELVPLSEVRENLFSFVQTLNEKQGHAILMRYSRPTAVLMSIDEYAEVLGRIEDLEDIVSVLKDQIDEFEGRDDSVPFDKIKADLGVA